MAQWFRLWSKLLTVVSLAAESGDGNIKVVVRCFELPSLGQVHSIIAAFINILAAWLAPQGYGEEPGWRVHSKEGVINDWSTCVTNQWIKTYNNIPVHSKFDDLKLEPSIENTKNRWNRMRANAWYPLIVKMSKKMCYGVEKVCTGLEHTPLSSGLPELVEVSRTAYGCQ